MSGGGEPWHLDKRVPIALIVTIIVQTGGMIWWASGLTHRVDQHGREIAALTADGRTYGVDAARTREVLARLEERMAAQIDLLRRVEQAVQRQGSP